MQPTEATQPGQASEAEHQLLTELEREALRSEQLREGVYCGVATGGGENQRTRRIATAQLQL